MLNDVVTAMGQVQVRPVAELDARQKLILDRVARLAESRTVTRCAQVLTLGGVKPVFPQKHRRVHEGTVGLQGPGSLVIVTLHAVGPALVQLLRMTGGDRFLVGHGRTAGNQKQGQN